MQDKVRENKLRRMAQRQGLRVVKSRRRDPQAYDYNGYMILDTAINGIVAGSQPMEFSFSLDDVERFLQQR